MTWSLPGRTCGRAGVALAGLALACALGPPAAAAPMLVVDVAGQGPDCILPACSMSVGGEVAVSITADEIPSGSDGRGLFGFGFRILFDGGALEASTPAIDGLWAGVQGTTQGFGSVGATANLFDPDTGQSLAPGPAGDGIALATVVFEALAPGLHTLALTHLTGEGDNLLFDGTALDGPDATGFFPTATLEVVAAPEPSAGALVGAAALAAAGLRRRR